MLNANCVALFGLVIKLQLSELSVDKNIAPRKFTVKIWMSWFVGRGCKKFCVNGH